jgi:hypothetical protein
MKNLKRSALWLSFLTALLCLQGCGEGKKKLDGQIVKTADGRFFTIHYNIGDTYWVRPFDTEKAKSTAEFIEKEK